METEIATLNERVADLQSLVDDLMEKSSPASFQEQQDDQLKWVEIEDQVLYAESSEELSQSMKELDWMYEPQRWEIVSAFCHSVERMIFVSKHKRKTAKEVSTRFHVKTIPSIPIAAYIKRIAWFTECSNQCFVLALEYIHRLARYRPEFEVNRHSLHQLIITAVMVAAKYFDDLFFKNSFYAEVGGISTSVLNGLEVQLMQFLGFDLYIQQDQYEARYQAMLIDNQGPSMVRIGPEGHWRDAVGGDWSNMSFDSQWDSRTASKPIDDVRDEIWHKASIRTSKYGTVLRNQKKIADGKRRLENPLDSTSIRYERRATSTKAQWLQ